MPTPRTVADNGPGSAGREADLQSDLFDHTELQSDHHRVNEIIGIELFLDGLNMHFDSSRRDAQESSNGLNLMAFSPLFKHDTFLLRQPTPGVGTFEGVGQSRNQVAKIFQMSTALRFRIQDKRDVAAQFMIPRLNSAAAQRVLQVILPDLPHELGVNLCRELVHHFAPDKCFPCPQPLRKDRIPSEHPRCEIPAKERFGIADTQEVAESVSTGVAPCTEERPIGDEGMYPNKEPVKLSGSSAFPSEAVNGIE